MSGLSPKYRPKRNRIARRLHRTAIVLVLYAFAGCGEATPDASAPDASTPDAPAAQVESALLPTFVIRGEPTPRTSLADRMEALEVPGVSVAVLVDGEIAWARGYGFADLESRRPVTTNTLFQAASISKPVAALAALQLVREGRVALDADVNGYLTKLAVVAQVVLRVPGCGRLVSNDPDEEQRRANLATNAGLIEWPGE